MSQVLLDAAKIGDTKKVTELLNTAATNVNYIDEHGNTALHFSAQYGHKEIVKLLLAAKAEIEAKMHELTPLHMAAIYKKAEIVKLLLEAKADVNAKACGMTTFELILDESNRTTLKLLLENNADVNARNNSGTTILHEAVKFSNIRQVKLLLEFNADVNARDDFGTTILYSAVEKGQTEIIKLLLGTKIDIEARTKGSTALHEATKKGNTEIIKLLLAKKANIEAKDEHNNDTPLHLAAWKGHTEAVKLLIKAKADIEAKDKAGETTLHVASEYGYTDIVKLLLEAKANVNAQTKDGITPLQLTRDVGIAEILLHYGALVDFSTVKIDLTNLINTTQTLMKAADDSKFSKENIENTLSLLKNGLNGRRKEDGNTALHLAIEKNPDLAVLLIRNGAAIDIPNNENLTAVHLVASLIRNGTAIIPNNPNLIIIQLIVNMIIKKKNPLFITLINLALLNRWIKVKSSLLPQNKAYAAVFCGKDVKAKSDENQSDNIKDLTANQGIQMTSSSSGNLIFSKGALPVASPGSASKASVNATATGAAFSSGCKEEYDKIFSEWYGFPVRIEEIIKETYDCINNLDIEKSMSFSFELGEILKNHFGLFGHHVLPMAYDLLSRFDSNYPKTKTIHTHCYELLLFATAHGYILQERSKSLDMKPKLHLLKSELGVELNHQKTMQLMSLTQIKHLLQSNSEQQPIVGKLMGDFLTDQNRLLGIPGVTGGDLNSMISLFLFAKKKIAATKQQLKNAKAENAQLKTMIVMFQSQQTKSKMESTSTTVEPPNSVNVKIGTTNSSSNASLSMISNTITNVG